MQGWRHRRSRPRARAGGRRLTAAGSLSVAMKASSCRSSMSQTICPTRPWPTTMACPFSPSGGAAASSGSSGLRFSIAATMRRRGHRQQRDQRHGERGRLPARSCEPRRAQQRRAPSPGRCRRRRTRRRDRAAGRSRSPPRRGTRNSRARPAISDGLDGDEPDHRGEQPERLARQLAKIDVHADGEEEDAEQQALERLDGGLDGLAELGLGQQQSGHERAERHRQAGHAGGNGGADDHEQDGGHEQLGRAGGRDQAKDRPAAAAGRRPR